MPRCGICRWYGKLTRKAGSTSITPPRQSAPMVTLACCQDKPTPPCSATVGTPRPVRLSESVLRHRRPRCSRTNTALAWRGHSLSTRSLVKLMTSVCTWAIASLVIWKCRSTAVRSSATPPPPTSTCRRWSRRLPQPTAWQSRSAPSAVHG